MQLLGEFLILKSEERLKSFCSMNGVYNILFGCFLIMAILLCLYKESKMEDTAFVLDKKKVPGICIFFLCGIVSLASPFPLERPYLARLVSYSVFYIVYGVTSYTDKQIGLFRAGYMMIGVFITACLTLIFIPMWLRDGWGTHLLLALFVMAINLFLGMFAYRFGDALLYLMTQFCILLWLMPDVWAVAMIVGLISAMTYFVILYAKEFVKQKEKRKVRFPFTMCLFLGSLTSFFLFL
jgi:hypothetical protein